MVITTHHVNSTPLSPMAAAVTTARTRMGNALADVLVPTRVDVGTDMCQ